MDKVTNVTRIYEEYNTPSEKKRAQRGAKRMKPTGKARGYCIVTELYRGSMFAMSPIVVTEPGSLDTWNMASCEVGWEWLRKNCRRVGRKYLPKEWADYVNNLYKK